MYSRNHKLHQGEPQKVNVGLKISQERGREKLSFHSMCHLKVLE
jgi:hypothetical protein